ncbi:MAG: hypothetical protein II010_05420, partial [Oscillospiraceae bacterium]|nr:hypothetical protein [Oscillospiraceae bacterium]
LRKLDLRHSQCFALLRNFISKLTHWLVPPLLSVPIVQGTPQRCKNFSRAKCNMACCIALERRLFYAPARGTTDATPFFSFLKQKTVSSRQKEKRFCGSANLHCCLVFWNGEKSRRNDTATESAAAHTAREGMPSTDLPKKLLNRLGWKRFIQVCASTPARNAQAAAVREADRS